MKNLAELTIRLSGTHALWAFCLVLEQGNPDVTRRTHNAGHRFIGGHMAGAFSPNDPVFWLHHANVDRIWAQWQDYQVAQNPGSTHDNHWPGSGGALAGHWRRGAARPQEERQHVAMGRCGTRVPVGFGIGGDPQPAAGSQRRAGRRRSGRPRLPGPGLQLRVGRRDSEPFPTRQNDDRPVSDAHLSFAVVSSLLRAARRGDRTSQKAQSAQSVPGPGPGRRGSPSPPAYHCVV